MTESIYKALENNAKVDKTIVQSIVDFIKQQLILYIQQTNTARRTDSIKFSYIENCEPGISRLDSPCYKILNTSTEHSYRIKFNVIYPHITFNSNILTLFAAEKELKKERINFSEINSAKGYITVNWNYTGC